MRTPHPEKRRIKFIRNTDDLSYKELKKLWIEEAESRVNACEKGLLKTIPLNLAKEKFEQRKRKL